MRNVTTAIAWVLAIVLLAGVAGEAKDPPPAEPETPVTLEDIHERGIAGTLGPPLGTILEVSGEVVANDSRSKADALEPFFLRIDEVDGRRLEAPQMFSSKDMPLIRKAPDLKVGDTFRCIGYETGAFSGSPDGEFKYVQPYATHRFHFAVRFVVLKLISTGA